MAKHTHTIRRLLPTNCLSVFDNILGLALKGLNNSSNIYLTYQIRIIQPSKINISEAYLRSCQASKMENAVSDVKTDNYPSNTQRTENILLFSVDSLRGLNNRQLGVPSLVIWIYSFFHIRNYFQFNYFYFLPYRVKHL